MIDEWMFSACWSHFRLLIVTRFSLIYQINDYTSFIIFSFVFFLIPLVSIDELCK